MEGFGRTPIANQSFLTTVCCHVRVAVDRKWQISNKRMIVVSHDPVSDRSSHHASHTFCEIAFADPAGWQMSKSVKHFNGAHAAPILLDRLPAALCRSLSVAVFVQEPADGAVKAAECDLLARRACIVDILHLAFAGQN